MLYFIAEVNNEDCHGCYHQDHCRSVAQKVYMFLDETLIYNPLSCYITKDAASPHCPISLKQLYVALSKSREEHARNIIKKAIRERRKSNGEST